MSVAVLTIYKHETGLGMQQIGDHDAEVRLLNTMYGKKLFEQYMDVLSDASFFTEYSKCYKHSTKSGDIVFWH